MSAQRRLQQNQTGADAGVNVDGTATCSRAAGVQLKSRSSRLSAFLIRMKIASEEIDNSRTVAVD